MDRRSALKQAALLAGGLAWLPSCDFGPQRVAVALDNLQLDVNLQDLLAKVAATILPSNKGESDETSSSDDSPGDDSLGSEELDLYRFILVMVDDCIEKEDQQAFSNGLQQLVPFTKAHFEKPFPRKEQAENEAILTQLMEMKDAPAAKESAEVSPAEQLKDIQAFLGITKRYTVQGYMASEYFMTEKFPYKLVPGPYQACVSIEGLTIM
ncbi:gluconate 2-dehydrogenase subunit 3 family protein [Tunicatimonas pelagia]|uniref:gluconate 2-dehydrogenase subunit 3 family protein n=1 Tax=Tunicatimonas pelagia TaxID=931531 RepID=UPI002666F80E|nr:gluconate 2-dehydrogenase subunit 3 family protein [Tunicatimonas pelagia]WKN41259.1 gluconate 2-dehydrogenase subunit 3 family protein [Tunicatimonas pelagia]